MSTEKTLAQCKIFLEVTLLATLLDMSSQQR